MAENQEGNVMRKAEPVPDYVRSAIAGAVRAGEHPVRDWRRFQGLLSLRGHHTALDWLGDHQSRIAGIVEEVLNESEERKASNG